MKFQKIGLDLLLGELADLPSEWMDDQARHLVAEIPAVIERIRAIGPEMNAGALATLLKEQPVALDVLRLLAAEGQEPMAHRILPPATRARFWGTPISPS